MPRMNNIGTHQGQVLSGISNNGPGMIQLNGQRISSNVNMVTATTPRGLPSGRIVSLNANNEFETGLDPADATPIPFMLYQTDQYDSDVDTNITNWDPAVDPGEGYCSLDTGSAVVAVPVIPGYLFGTTEYDPADVAALAVPNRALTSPRANTNAALGGLIKPGTFKTDHICGITVPTITGQTPIPLDPYRPTGISMVWFFGYFFPKIA